MKVGIAVGLALAVAATVAGAVVFLVLPDSSPATPAQQATSEAMARYELRIEPRVFRQAQLQPWFNKGNPTPEGLRLLNLLSEYYVSQRAIDLTKVLETYPAGLDEDLEALLLQLKLGSLIRSVAIAPWFTDGVTASEASYLAVLGEAWTRQGTTWTFDDVVLQAMTKPWFQDAIDEKEATVFNAAADLSGRNQPKALKLVEGLESNVFVYETVQLPMSGEKTLIVTAAPGALEAQVAPALALVKRWMVDVEGLAGPYNPRYVLVSIEELTALCGTGSAQGIEVPGFVTLHIGCVTESTVVHELTHVFVGSGPIWFSEGIAEVFVYHLTGRTGNYLGFPAEGKIKINYRLRRTEGYPPDYREQGALGAKLLIEVYRLIGPDETFNIIRQVIADDLPREGPLLRDQILSGTPDNLKPKLSALFAERFEAP